MYFIDTNFISTVLNKKLISIHFAVKVGERGDLYTHRRFCRKHRHSQQACVWLSVLSYCKCVVFSVKQSERVIYHVCLCAEHINRKSRGEAMTTHVPPLRQWWGDWFISFRGWSDWPVLCVWVKGVAMVVMFYKNLFLTVVCSTLCTSLTQTLSPLFSTKS